MKKIKCGDVFEIGTKNGKAFFEYAKEPPATECEVIRILPGIYKESEIIDFNTLTEEKELFFIQFPLKYAVKQKSVKFIGNYRIPEAVSIPKYYRDKHIVKGEFLSWHIIDSDTLQIRSVKELSDEEKKTISSKYME